MRGKAKSFGRKLDRAYIGRRRWIRNLKKADLAEREQGAVFRNEKMLAISAGRAHVDRIIGIWYWRRWLRDRLCSRLNEEERHCLTPVFTQLATRSIKGRQVRCTPARCQCRAMITPLAPDAVPRATGRARSHPRRRSTAARASFTITGCAVHVVTRGSRCCTCLFEMLQS